ncbi:hypothetical protein LK494_06515 [Anaerovorax odorimutans]|nr:hypothetical protein [Anaerovorax odorimutans]
MKSRIKEDLKNLSQLITVSGGEEEAIRYVYPRLKECCDHVEITGVGNVIATKKGSSKGPRMLITAHMDEIGFTVKNITANGFLLFEKVGGVADGLLPARRVWIQAKEEKIPGVIGMRAAHLMPSNDNAPFCSTSYIDIGACSREEVLERGVFIGSKVAFQSDFTELGSPDLVCTKSIDDKLCCSILLNIMESLGSDELKGELIAVFSTLEETTVAGMVPIYNYVDPDYAIVLDTVPCGDVPDIDTENELPVSLGRGPVMIVSQGIEIGGRYNNINPKIRELLYLACEKANITMQELAISDRFYITEESLAFQCGEKGIPAATVAVPRRYSHTPVEVANMNDALKTYELIMELIKVNDAVKMTFI